MLLQSYVSKCCIFNYFFHAIYDEDDMIVLAFTFQDETHEFYSGDKCICLQNKHIPFTSFFFLNI